MTNFLMVSVFSLLIGLSQRKLYQKEDDSIKTFGSDRTFTLIGILGYILYVVGKGSLVPFLCGGATLSVLLSISYCHKIFKQGYHGITSIVIALITYCLTPVIYEKEIWMGIIIVVSILILTEMKSKFIEFTKMMNDEEFLNLGKFLIIAGVVLPILPNSELIEGMGLTPYNIWLATVVISGISYISYLLKKYVFKNGGIIVTGILGGIYSSTATCIILAKKAKKRTSDANLYVSALFCAITMMYFKFLALLGIFNGALMRQYWPLFAIMIVVSALTALYYYKKSNEKDPTDSSEGEADEEKNPLEFKVAILFAVLFVAFTLVTQYALDYFGDSGLRILSIIVGVTDINPFVINLFQAPHNVSDTLLMLATFQAIISNNVVKMLYGIFFSGRRIMRQLAIGFGIICVINIALVLIFLS